MKKMLFLCSLLTTISFIGCTSASSVEKENKPILEQQVGIVLEKETFRGWVFLVGIEYHCDLVIQLKDGNRIFIKGREVAGAFEYEKYYYEKCQLSLRGDEVKLARSGNNYWYWDDGLSHIG